ncbi:hypothetical protein HK100_004597, partial [Physocladia obscura]
MTGDSLRLLTGVFIVVTMNAMSSLGVNLQAYALKGSSSESPEQTPLLHQHRLSRQQQQQQQQQQQYQSVPQNLRQRLEPSLWIIGFVCYIIPQLFGSLIALYFISPILLAPLGASGLVFNVFFSSLLVGTQVGLWDWVATAFIVIGGIIVSVFGNVDVEIKGFNTFYAMIATKLFAWYYSAVFLFLIAALGAAVFLETRQNNGWLFSSPVTRTVSERQRSHQDLERLAGSRDRHVDTTTAAAGSRSSSRMSSSSSATATMAAVAFSNHIGLLYSLVGGVSAAFTLTIVKCGLNLASNYGGSAVELAGGFQQMHWISDVFASGLLIVALVSAVLLQLVALNKAIVFISPLIAIPVFYTFFTSLSVSNSLVIIFSLPGFPLPPGIGASIEMSILGVSVIIA